MDMMDILGGLLGAKRGSGGGKESAGGSDIFGDILGRVGKASRPNSQSSASPPPRSGDLAKTARDLEDLLGVARDRDAGRAGSQAQKPTPPRPRAEPESSSHDPFARPAPGREATFPQPAQPTENDQAQVLVQAMVNAAKSDGRITADEQSRILGQFNDAPPHLTRFLREELARPLDVRAFAWSVPLGMEQQVYAMSLMAIAIDSRAESEYLNDLAHGLRIPPDVRKQLEQKYATA